MIAQKLLAIATDPKDVQMKKKLEIKLKPFEKSFKTVLSKLLENPKIRAKIIKELLNPMSVTFKLFSKHVHARDEFIKAIEQDRHTESTALQRRNLRSRNCIDILLVSFHK